MTTLDTASLTGAVSRQGQKNLAGDPLQLFLRVASSQVMTAFEERNFFSTRITQMTIQNGKSEIFPIIGRRRGASEHTPGDQLIGGSMEHNEREITLDPILVDSLFRAEIDDLMAYYDASAPYMTQLGESLSTAYDRRAAIMMVLASRNFTPSYAGAPVPAAKISHINMATDPIQLENAAAATFTRFQEQDISGSKPTMFLPFAQQMLLARASMLDTTFTTGQADRGNATIGKLAGLDVVGVNHLPNTLITTGNTKYQGDFTKTVGVISTPMSVGCLNLRGLKLSVTQKEDRLGWLMIASKACGFGQLRPECAQEFGTP